MGYGPSRTVAGQAQCGCVRATLHCDGNGGAVLCKLCQARQSPRVLCCAESDPAELRCVKPCWVMLCLSAPYWTVPCWTMLSYDELSWAIPNHAGSCQNVLSSVPSLAKIYHATPYWSVLSLAMQRHEELCQAMTTCARWSHTELCQLTPHTSLWEQCIPLHGLVRCSLAQLPSVQCNLAWFSSTQLSTVQHSWEWHSLAIML